MNTETTQPDRLLSWPRVRSCLGDMSRSTAWRLRRTPEANFPKPIPISAGRIAWRESDVQAWIKAQAEKAHA
ncbi:helix-turn-helix transcriptional regulator [Brevundimonas sp. TWP2-3-4b1]|uniref:helix-turn-helix transcriptional regulator n=1 Tax=Brevundimonas sp. TWP2-3-4b1 TaxID=2804580 RepID=UPI003CF8A1DA